MDTLTLVPVSSYLDADTDGDNTLCAYFPTRLFHQLLDYIGRSVIRFAVLGCSDVVNNKVRYCNDLSIRTIQIYGILWQQTGACFAGIACRACKPASIFPYVYEIMTGVPARSMMVMMISYNKEFKVINFDDSFPDWYRQNNRNQ